MQKHLLRASIFGAVARYLLPNFLSFDGLRELRQFSKCGYYSHYSILLYTTDHMLHSCNPLLHNKQKQNSCDGSSQR